MPKQNTNRKASTKQCAYCGDRFKAVSFADKCCSFKCLQELKRDQLEYDQLQSILASGKDPFEEHHFGNPQ